MVESSREGLEVRELGEKAPPLDLWGSEIRSRMVTCVSVTAGAVRRRCSTRGSVHRGLVSGGSGARRG